MPREQGALTAWVGRVRHKVLNLERARQCAGEELQMRKTDRLGTDLRDWARHTAKERTGGVEDDKNF